MQQPTSETAEQVKLKVVAAAPGGEQLAMLAVSRPEGKTSEIAPPEPGSSSSAAPGAGTSNSPAGGKQPTSLRSKHPSVLHQILADPGAAEEDWLAACYEMEKHPNYRGFESNGSKRAARGKKLLVACGVLALVGVSSLAILTGLTSASKPAAPPAQIAPVADVDFGPYMAKVQRQIKRNWYPPKSDITSSGKVIFKVAKNGEVSDLRILRPGPTAAFDRAALLAVTNASQSFDPLPDGSPKDVDIEFSFDYNVHN